MIENVLRKLWKIVNVLQIDLNVYLIKINTDTYACVFVGRFMIISDTCGKSFGSLKVVFCIYFLNF